MVTITGQYVIYPPGQRIYLNLLPADYVFAIDLCAVRYIMRSHGNMQKEEARGQKAVTVNDFELIHQTINNPDVVFYDGENRIGRDVIQFQKRIGSHYIILVGNRSCCLTNRMLLELVVAKPV